MLCDHCDEDSVDLYSVPVELDADEDGTYAVFANLCASCAPKAELEWEHRFPQDPYAERGLTRGDFL